MCADSLAKLGAKGNGFIMYWVSPRSSISNVLLVDIRRVGYCRS